MADAATTSSEGAAAAPDGAGYLEGMREGPAVLLIDASYFVFYRYYATLRWHSFQNRTPDGKPGPGPERPCEDAAFMAAFEKQARARVSELIRQWGSCPENTVFCYDCCGANIWRMRVGDAAESYKATRVAGANFSGEIFPRFYAMLESGALGEGLRVASGAALEADDVVYGLVRRLRGGDAPPLPATPPIVCISNDNDYLQLLRFPGLRVFNLQDKDLAERSCGCPEKDLWVKVLSGDKSDNIAPCAKGIGPKTALKIAEMDDAARAALLEKKGGAAALEIAKHNRMLVDFRFIPEDLLEKMTLR